MTEHEPDTERVPIHQLAAAVDAGVMAAAARELVSAFDRHEIGVLVGIWGRRIYVAGLDAAMALELVALLDARRNAEG